MSLPFLMGVLGFGDSGCGAPSQSAAVPSSSATQAATEGATKKKMKITIGKQTFVARLDQSPTADAFKALLPTTLDMADLNRNEKHVDLPSRLPTDVKVPGRIEVGDLMLYGDRTIVLFYKSFETTYGYTRIGRIEDPAGLEAALGRGRATVGFAIE